MHVFVYTSGLYGSCIVESSDIAHVSIGISICLKASIITHTQDKKPT